MKKITIFSVLLAIFLASSAYAFEDGVIESASELDYPPYSIVTEDGEADGFAVELLRATLESQGLEVTFYVAPWAQIKQELADGKIQVLPLVSITPEREPIYDFTAPYLTFYGAVFVREDGPSITSKKDLIGKEILVLEGDHSHEYVTREKISDKIITVKAFPEAFNLLSEGQYDAIVAQEDLGNNIIKEKGITNLVAAVQLNDFRQDFAFAVKEGDAELLTVLNKGLSVIIADGTFTELYSKWFGKDFEETAIPDTPIIYFVIGGIILLALAITMFLFVKSKK